jgi:hypothetical protein
LPIRDRVAAKDSRPAPHMKIYAELDGLRALLDVAEECCVSGRAKG